MKIFITITIALIVTFGLAIILSIMIFKLTKEGDGMSKKKRVFFTLGVGFIFFVIGGILYFSQYSHAQSVAEECMKGNESVNVFDISEGYLFDGPGDQNALIFYQGAKVDEKAYSRLLLRIAEGGTDCFMVKMPLNMAFMNRNAAIKIANEYKYKNWFLCGHSLGGAMISTCVVQEPQLFRGMYLLGSYPSAPVAEEISFISFIGSEDKVVKMQEYDAGRKFWPANAREITIEGGNHSGYADYGQQKGDGVATISSEEQQDLVADTILEDIKSITGE